MHKRRRRNCTGITGLDRLSRFLFTGIPCSRGSEPAGDIDDMVTPDIMNDVVLSVGRYPENFMLIYQWEVCQEGGVKKGCTWRTLRVPDRSHG